MTRTFREALIEAQAKAKISFAAIARSAGVSPEQIKKIVQRENASTNVDDARKIASVFGMTIDEFLDGDLSSDQIRAARLLVELSDAELELLRAAARGRAAQAREEG